MNYIKALLLAASLFVAVYAKSQASFSHNLGTGIYLTEIGGCPFVEYNPRMNFVEIGDQISLSVSTPLAVGAYMVDGDGVYGFSLPVMGQINFGALSNPDNDAMFGAYLGAGYAYSFMDNFWSSNKAIGPIYHLGLIYSDYNAYGLRISFQQNTYTKYLNEGSGPMISIGIFMGLE